MVPALAVISGLYREMKINPSVTKLQISLSDLAVYVVSVLTSQGVKL